MASFFIFCTEQHWRRAMITRHARIEARAKFKKSQTISARPQTCTAPLPSRLLASLRMHVFFQKSFHCKPISSPSMTQRTQKGVAIKAVPAHTFDIQDIFLTFQFNGHYIFRRCSAIRNFLSMRGFHFTLHSLYSSCTRRGMDPGHPMRIQSLSTLPLATPFITSSPHRPSPGLPHNNGLPSKERLINGDNDMLTTDWRSQRGE